jgi:hypothetical protein
MADFDANYWAQRDRAQTLARRGPVAPRVDPAEAARQVGVYYLTAGGAVDRVPAIQREALAAISTNPEDGQTLIRLPNETTVSGLAGLQRYARERAAAEKLAGFGPDPQATALERLTAMGFDRAAAAQYASRLRRDTDGSIVFHVIGNVAVDPNFNASGPPSMKGGDEILTVAITQIAHALQASGLRARTAAEGTEGQARLAREEEVEARAHAEAAARSHVSGYPRF